MVHITFLVMEKMQYNHFPIISLLELSVAMETKPRARSVVLKDLSFKKFFNVKFNVAMGSQTKWPLVIKHINWIDNHQMIITAKYGSHHFKGYGENAI